MITQMLYFGARNETSRQLKKLLELNGMSNDEILREIKAQLNDLNYNDDLARLEVKLANNLYYDKEFEIDKSYTDLLRTYFENEPTGFNFSDSFSLIDAINEWVSSRTNNKINNLIPYDSTFDKHDLLLVNAIYFKGEWKMGFDPNKTARETFYLSDGQEEKVDMMKLHRKPFYFIESPDGLMANAYHLNYNGEKILMTIILPYMGFKLEDIETKLTPDTINGIISSKGFYVVDDISLPKFKLEYRKEVWMIEKFIFIKV